MKMRAHKRKRAVQLDLPFEARAKTRRRAGRKPAKGRRNVRHRARPAHAASHPLHVVLRSKFRPLRSRFVFPTLRKALAKATRVRADFRVVQFSVQSDHLHLIVEASNKESLSRGMQGLAIRVAKAVNQLVARRGKVWADRFFSRALPSPRAVKNALAYVLNNFRHHAATRLRGASRVGRIDPYSSAPYFRGFSELRGCAPNEFRRSQSLPLVPPGVPPPEQREDMPVVESKTWLAKGGWRRAGSISFSAPGVDERSPADRGIGA
jgi:putative transposase